jgi:hypothetical protein
MIVEASTQVFLRSGLPNQFLSQIWRLCLISSTNGLSFPEFCLNMFLIKAKMGGQSIPAALPENVSMAVLNSIASIQRHIALGSHPSSAQPQIGPSSVQPKIGPSIDRPQPSSSQQLGLSSNIPGRIAEVNSGNMHVNTYAKISSPVIIPTISDHSHSSIGVVDSAERSGWAVSAADKAKYDAIFRAWDLGNTGYMTVCLNSYIRRSKHGRFFLNQNFLPPFSIMYGSYLIFINMGS